MERTNETTELKRNIKINLGDDEHPFIGQYTMSISLPTDKLSEMTEDEIEGLFATDCVESATVSFNGIDLFSSFNPKIFSIDKA